jgi:hypothetical protein
MGRPRKGVVQRPDGQWTVSLPIAVGSRKTRQFTDPDETAVRRWYADGERALAAGQPLADPASYRTNRSAPALTALALGDRTPAHWWAGPTAAFGHRFDKVAEAFLVHHYDRQRSGRPIRALQRRLHACDEVPGSCPLRPARTAPGPSACPHRCVTAGAAR